LKQAQEIGHAAEIPETFWKHFSFNSD
jgi:hypothetical protein